MVLIFFDDGTIIRMSVKDSDLILSTGVSISDILVRGAGPEGALTLWKDTDNNILADANLRWISPTASAFPGTTPVGGQFLVADNIDLRSNAHRQFNVSSGPHTQNWHTKHKYNARTKIIYYPRRLA